MVSNLVKRIENIFSDMGNFDESGFVHPELVTPELAKDLWKMSDKDREALIKRGYEFHWFKLDLSDGMVTKWIKSPKKWVSYSLHLYYNQDYPIDIHKERGIVESDVARGGKGDSEVSPSYCGSA